MASKIQAIRAYSPRIKLREAVSVDQFRSLVKERAALSLGIVRGVEECILEILVQKLAEGRPVHTEFAIFTPGLNLDGSLRINVRMSRRVQRALEDPDVRQYEVRNARNIGKGGAELAQQWNADHPEDPVTP